MAITAGSLSQIPTLLAYWPVPALTPCKVEPPHLLSRHHLKRRLSGTGRSRPSGRPFEALLRLWLQGIASRWWGLCCFCWKGGFGPVAHRSTCLSHPHFFPSQPSLSLAEVSRGFRAWALPFCLASVLFASVPPFLPSLPFPLRDLFHSGSRPFSEPEPSVSFFL